MSAAYLGIIIKPMQECNYLVSVITDEKKCGIWIDKKWFSQSKKFQIYR